jgi:hypothetical protein
MLDNPESKQLKVAALKLFHPTTSPLFRKGVFLQCDTASKGGGIIISLFAEVRLLLVEGNETNMKDFQGKKVENFL